jgi:DNA repair protein RadD
MGLPPAFQHQIRARRGAEEAYRAGARRILIVLPTGAGKTYVGSSIVEGGISKGRRVAWLAHREELVDQAAASLARLGVDHGIVKAGRVSDRAAPIQVASVQTLAAAVARADACRARGDLAGALRELELLPEADIVVVDETHHVVARTWKGVLEAYKTKRGNRDLELILGLTATPERGDRSPLGDIFEVLIAPTSVKELQRTLRPDGSPVLVPCRIVGPGRYQDELWREPIEGLLEYARRPNGRLRPTIAFVGTVEEAHEIARKANAIGIRAAAIDGKMKKGEDGARAKALAAFARDELELLVSVMVLTEGFDDPHAEVCAIMRGCAASSTYLQMVGRVLRSSPATGKTQALLIDYKGLWDVHGLPDEDRVFSLHGKAISRTDRPAIRQCSKCGSIFCDASKCPECGAPLPILRKKKPRVKRTETVEVTGERRRASRAEQIAVYQQLCKTQKEKGYKPGWIGVQFKNRFGWWPSPERLIPTAPEARTA